MEEDGSQTRRKESRQPPIDHDSPSSHAAPPFEKEQQTEDKQATSIMAVG